MRIGKDEILYLTRKGVDRLEAINSGRERYNDDTDYVVESLGYRPDDITSCRHYANYDLRPGDGKYISRDQFNKMVNKAIREDLVSKYKHQSAQESLSSDESDALDRQILENYHLGTSRVFRPKDY